jgi:hypothetical protein
MYINRHGQKKLTESEACVLVGSLIVGIFLIFINMIEGIIPLFIGMVVFWLASTHDEDGICD